MSTSKFLHLYVDSKATDAFEIQANGTDAIFSYANKPLKFNGDVQYKSGVAYVSLVSKLGIVDQALSSETLARQTADTLLQSNLDAQVGLLDADVVDLNAQIQTEIDARVNADGLFQIALVNEIATRSTADTKQASDLSFEASRASSAEGVLLGKINTEASTARSAELTLRTDLATEVSDRKTADSGEVATRLSADNALGVRIDNEISRATSVEIANFQILDGYIATEQARAMTKENSLQNQVNFIIGNVDAKALDSLSELVSKLNSAGTDLYARVLFLESVVSSLRGEALYAATQAVYVPGVAPAVP